MSTSAQLPPCPTEIDRSYNTVSHDHLWGKVNAECGLQAATDPEFSFASPCFFSGEVCSLYRPTNRTVKDPRNNGSLEPKANERKILFHRLKTWPTNEHFDTWDYWKLYILLWNGAFERHFKGYTRGNIYKPHILRNAYILKTQQQKCKQSN